MFRYVVKRLLLMIPTLFGAAVLIFLLMRAIPGDICYLRLAAGGGTVAPDVLRICRAELGLDQPLIAQFLTFIKGLVTFDFGKSMWTNRPIIEEIGLRFQLSLQVAIMATLTAILIAIPLGTISAVRQNTWIDYFVRTFTIAGIAMPSFWLGILIILGILITSKAWFGVAWMPPIRYVPLWEDPWYNLSMLIWPALATGYRYSAVATRMTRSALLEVLREDYVRTARAKGLYEKLVINRHALRNALLPVVTVLGIEFAFLMGGLVVTEQVFNLNGIGRLFVQAVQNQDNVLTQALVMLVVVIFVVTNLVVDLLYAWLDPRIRFS
jgi:peptide/nickel transport system permease protein